MNDDYRLGSIVGANSDAFKGLLIVVVAADHNDWFRSLAPDLFGPLTFHVLGFFFLAFTYGVKSLSLRFILDRVARYLVPFWWVLTLTTIVYALAYRPDAGLMNRLTVWGLSLAIGSAPLVKDSSGFLMLWFLPALFGLTCCLALLSTPLSKRKNIGVIMAIAILTHLLLPLVGKEMLLWFPFGLGIAFEILILGLIWRYWLNISLPKTWPVLSFFAYLISFGALVYYRRRLEIATLDLYGVDHPVFMVLQDVSGIAGVLFTLWLARQLPSVNWLKAIGKYSLLIYLFHPIVYVLLLKVWPVSPSGSSGLTWLLLSACATTTVALFCAYVMAALVYQSPVLSKWLVPRVWVDWPPAKLFALFHR